MWARWAGNWTWAHSIYHVNQTRMPDYSLNWTRRSSALQCYQCSSPAGRWRSWSLPLITDTLPGTNVRWPAKKVGNSLTFTSFKDQPTWNQTSALSILPLSRARNRNLSLVLALFWPVTHTLCCFNNDLPKFTAQVHHVYKHTYNFHGNRDNILILRRMNV